MFVIDQVGSIVPLIQNPQTFFDGLQSIWLLARGPEHGFHFSAAGVDGLSQAGERHAQSQEGSSSGHGKGVYLILKDGSWPPPS